VEGVKEGYVGRDLAEFGCVTTGGDQLSVNKRATEGRRYIPMASSSSEQYDWGLRPDDARVCLFGGIAERHIDYLHERTMYT
jgi:hypothetical protein